MSPARKWTRDLVADRLVAAFGRMAGRPVMSRARGFAIDGVEVEPFGWPDRFVEEARDRRYLMTWARCRAQKESVKRQYDAFGWARSTVEDRRRKALDKIAAGLNAAGHPCLK